MENRIIDSYCGLPCAGCPWRESHGCGGCIETDGHPFHGECSIAQCCQAKGCAHCGECGIIPCGKLYAYSYLDPEHGDKPQGKRVERCRRWAAETGTHLWENVLLTSAGFEDTGGKRNKKIVSRFLQMLGMPPNDARTLFIPTAAISDTAKKMVDKCHRELIGAGIAPENIKTYDIDGHMTADEAMQYDAVYFTGGDTGHLLRRIRETGFDGIIKKMVYANKAYVGVSAGSIIATPNIGEPYNKDTAGLCLINAYISVHCAEGNTPRAGLPLPHIPLTDNQALAVSWHGYELIEG